MCKEWDIEKGDWYIRTNRLTTTGAFWETEIGSIICKFLFSRAKAIQLSLSVVSLMISCYIPNLC